MNARKERPQGVASLEDVFAAVLASYNLQKEDITRSLKGVGANHPAVEAKRTLAYLLSRDAKLTTQRIARALGLSNDATVRQSLDLAERKYSESPELRTKIEEIRSRYPQKTPA